ncbi:MAG: universal stress protein, partial [Deltaproteobacteria bacterium]|nr:universal stress protein [Deltaproteobacteria bacterium]
MYKNILVCLDGSPQDQYVSQSAFWMAERLGATLHAFHVIDQLALEGPLLYDISGSLSFGPQMNFLEETRKVMQARAEIILSDFQKACEERHIPFKTHIEESVVHHAIVERSDLHDLTLLGRRGLNYKLDKDLMGSTTDRVIRRIQSPVMVVTHDFTDIHSPLLAFDGSHNAREAMISAVRLLSDLKLPLTVLYVGSNEEEAKEVLAQAK